MSDCEHTTTWVPYRGLVSVFATSWSNFWRLGGEEPLIKFCPDCGARLADTREGPQSPSVQDLLDADVTGSGVIMSDEFFDDSTMDAAKGER